MRALRITCFCRCRAGYERGGRIPEEKQREEHRKQEREKGEDVRRERREKKVDLTSAKPSSFRTLDVDEKSIKQ